MNFKRSFELFLDKKIEDKKRRRKENSMITDRSLEEYCRYFNFTPEELKGKKILDIGSGKKETFSKEAAKYGAEVVSISPELRRWYKRKRLKGWLISDSEWQRRSIAARAQKLPFKDNYFDIITAVYSIPHYSPSHQDTYVSIQEMLRVLKKGGKVYIAPINDGKDINETIKRTFGEKTTQWLKENETEFQVNIGKDYVPDEVGYMTRCISIEKLPDQEEKKKNEKDE